MAKSELKKLNRAQLLELLLELEEENDHLHQKLLELQARLDDRTIRVEKCGSLAKASLELNGVFSAAEAACKQYSENMQRMAEKRLQDTEAQCRRMLEETEERCRRLEEQATMTQNRQAAGGREHDAAEAGLISDSESSDG